MYNVCVFIFIQPITNNNDVDDNDISSTSITIKHLKNIFFQIEKQKKYGF